MASIKWLLLLGTAAAAACTSDSAAGPPAPPCNAALATDLALAVGAYTAIDPAADSGCVSFPANASSDSAEYVVIAQSAGGVPGDTALFALRSASLVAGAAPVTARRAGLLGRRGSIAARFDGMLHERERSRRAIARTSAVRPSAAGTGVAAVTPPTLGSLRTFTVCASLDCTTYKPVTARAQSVGAHVAIYVDTAAPANGLTATDIDTLQQVFDTHVYVVDTTAFGSVSDIDSNGVVITLMTPVVNSLVTNAECQAGGFVAGFADPADLPPRHIPARAAAPHQLQPARADPRGEPGGPLARRSAVFVRRRARGAELPPRLDDIRDVRLLGPGRRLRLSRRPRRSFPAAGERYRPRGLRRGMVVRALSGRPVRRLTDRPARADRAHRSRQRRGANRALVRDDDDQMGPRQLGVRPSRVRAPPRGVLPVMVVTDRSSHRSPRRTRSTFRCRSHWCHRRAPAHK